MRCRLLLLVVLLSSLPAHAVDLVLVANPSAGIARLGHDEVVNIYMGRYRRLPSGQTAEPLDMPGNSEVRSLFYRRLVDKSSAEINAYWSRLVFSGSTKPPQAITSPDAALRYVATHPNALAYIERSLLDARVAVVFELKE